MVKLGEMRAVEAIPLFIEHLDFYYTSNKYQWPGPTMVDNRVAVPALVKIGKPALESILQAARTEDNKIRLICEGLPIV